MSHCVNKQEEIRSDFLLSNPKDPSKSKEVANEAHKTKGFELTSWSQLLNNSDKTSAFSLGVLPGDMSCWHLPRKTRHTFPLHFL